MSGFANAEDHASSQLYRDKIIRLLWQVGPEIALLKFAGDVERLSGFCTLGFLSTPEFLKNISVAQFQYTARR
jgi:hypothetical protein